MSWKAAGKGVVFFFVILGLSGCASGSKKKCACSKDGGGMEMAADEHGCTDPEGAAMICPVSKRGIKEGKGVVLEHEGKKITFCCKNCIPAFQKDPEKFSE